MFNEVQATQKVVGPEVEAYLRTPAVVEARKALRTVMRNIQRLVERAEIRRQELDETDKEVAVLTVAVAKLEPLAEELVWLKDKRRR